MTSEHSAQSVRCARSAWLSGPERSAVTTSCSCLHGKVLIHPPLCLARVSANKACEPSPCSIQQQSNAAGLQSGAISNLFVGRPFHIGQPEQFALAKFQSLKCLPHGNLLHATCRSSKGIH